MLWRKRSESGSKSHRLKPHTVHRIGVPNNINASSCFSFSDSLSMMYDVSRGWWMKRRMVRARVYKLTNQTADVYFLLSFLNSTSMDSELVDPNNGPCYRNEGWTMVIGRPNRLRDSDDGSVDRVALTD